MKRTMKDILLCMSRISIRMKALYNLRTNDNHTVALRLPGVTQPLYLNFLTRFTDVHECEEYAKRLGGGSLSLEEKYDVFLAAQKDVEWRLKFGVSITRGDVAKKQAAIAEAEEILAGSVSRT